MDRNRLHRVLVLVLVRVHVLAAVLVGAHPARAATETSEISFWAVGATPDDVAMYRRLGQEFQQRTGVAVRVTPLGWGDYETKYFAAMAAQLPPDVGVTNLSGPAEYGAVGGLIDLQEEFPGEIAELRGRFYPAILPRFTFRGHLYGLPTEVATLLLYYRKDIFQKLGLQPPATWSELDSAISVLERHGLHFFFGWTWNEQWADYLHTLPFGLPGVSQGPRLDWNEPAYQRGILHALDLWHMHARLEVGELLGPRIIGRFLSDDPGAVAMFVDENRYYQTISGLFPQKSAQWGVLPWPRADQGTTVNLVGGTAYVIFSRSKHKRAAFEFLQYLNSLPVQQAMLLDRMGRQAKDAIFTISPVKAMWDEGNAAFWAKPQFAQVAPLVQTLAQVARSLRTTEQVLGQRQAEQIEQNILDRMGGVIRDELDALAARHDLGRWELVQRLAAGDFADEQAALRARVADRLRAEYAAQAPIAEQLLLREDRQYQQRYGDVLHDLRSYEHRADVLTCLEWAAGLLLLGLCGLVLGVRRLRRHRASYLFIAAPVGLAVVFVFIPALTALYLSFTEYHPVLPLATARYVGLRHYAEVLASGELLRVLWRTALYVVLTVPAGVALSLGLAALLNNPLRGSRWWRFVYFSPFVTSAVSVALIFAQLYQPSEAGWINALLLHLHLVRDPLPLLKSESSFLYCVIGLAIWHELAFNILIFLAALQQVPGQLYQAAALDGAGWLRKFWHVSLPGIRPQVLFITIVGVIGGFQVFEPIYMLGGGSGYAGAKFGPNDAGMTMVPYIYHAGFETFRMGRAAAIAYILFALIFAFTLLQFRLTRGRAEGPR